ncbi:hypothetical protein D3C72_1241450 [compost metagenome]
MQLVEQRLELVFADHVVGFLRRRYYGRRRVAAVQLIEQGLEFVVGDQVSTARIRRRGRRCCRATAMHIELGDQVGRGKAGLGTR